jgi:hypothetical protein
MKRLALALAFAVLTPALIACSAPTHAGEIELLCENTYHHQQIRFWINADTYTIRSEQGDWHNENMMYDVVGVPGGIMSFRFGPRSEGREIAFPSNRPAGTAAIYHYGNDYLDAGQPVVRGSKAIATGYMPKPGAGLDYCIIPGRIIQ